MLGSPSPQFVAASWASRCSTVADLCTRYAGPGKTQAHPAQLPRWRRLSSFMSRILSRSFRRLRRTSWSDGSESTRWRSVRFTRLPLTRTGLPMRITLRPAAGRERRAAGRLLGSVHPRGSVVRLLMALSLQAGAAFQPSHGQQALACQGFSRVGQQPAFTASVHPQLRAPSSTLSTATLDCAAMSARPRWPHEKRRRRISEHMVVVLPMPAAADG